MTSKGDHSRRIATTLMNVLRMTTPSTVGRPELVNSRLFTALAFNVGRHRETGFGKDSRTVAQEELQYRAALVGVRRARTGCHDRCNFTTEKYWIQDAFPSQAEAERQEAFRREVVAQASSCRAPQSARPPVLTTLLDLVTLLDRRWVYLGLLLARVGEAEHGWMSLLAGWAFLPRASSNRQSCLSSARKHLAEIDAQLSAASEGPVGDALGQFLGRLESRFSLNGGAEPRELADFVAADRLAHPGQGPSIYGRAWQTLTTLAGYDPEARQRLVAALHCYHELTIRPDGPHDALASWLGDLEETPPGQHPPAEVLRHLQAISADEPAALPARRRRGTNRISPARLVRRLPKESWGRSLFAQVRRDCRLNALIAWASCQVAAPSSFAQYPGLRRAVRGRLRAWREYAAGCREGGWHLLFLEMPEGQHTNAPALTAARALVASAPASWEGVGPAARVLVLAAVASVRLDRLCEWLRACRSKNVSSGKGSPDE